MALIRAVRFLLTSNLTIYVDSVKGSDVGNNGFSPGSAFKTLQAAYNSLQQGFDFGGNVVTIQHAANQTFGDNLTITSAWVGGGRLIIDLGGGTWNVTSADCLDIFDTAISGNLTLQNGTLETTTSGSCLVLEGSGVNLFLGAGITFGACALVHMIAQVGAHIEIPNNYAISGGAVEHFNTQIGGIIAWNGATVTVSNNPAFTFFAFSQLGGQAFFFNGANFTGSATGQRYLIENGGSIFTNGGGANFFPGSTPGSVASSPTTFNGPFPITVNDAQGFYG